MGGFVASICGSITPKDRNEPRRDQPKELSTKGCITGAPLVSAVESSAILAVGWEPVRIEGIEAAYLHASTGSRSRGMRWIAAEHRDTGAKFGAAKGNHVLAVRGLVGT